MAGPNTDLFDSYFRRADLDGDGRISGAEAVGFFQGANLPKNVLAQIWMYADQNKVGYLGRAEFYNALKLVTVAQSKRQLTPEIVKAALHSPASAKIPAPQINLATTPSPQMNSRTPVPAPRPVSPSPQLADPRAPHSAVSASNNQQYFPSQLNQTMRPPHATPTAHIPHPQQVGGSQGMPGTVNMAPPPQRPPSSNVSADWVHGRTGNQMMGVNSQVSNSGTSPPSSQNGFGLTESALTPSVQPRQTATGQAPYSAQTLKDSGQAADRDSKALVVSGNGPSSDSLFGDVFSTTQSQPSQDGLSITATASSVAASPAIVPASAGPQPAQKPNPLDAYNRSTPQPVGAQSQQVQARTPHSVGAQSQQGQARPPHPVGVQGQARGNQSQQFLPHSATASASSGFPAGAGNSASSQSEPPWPKMTQSSVQKYTKVFMEVDKDRDGKITGLEARNLFLSWRLPREVLKQVWDLSDQDNDSMLSLREFCYALYLMERSREGRPLPAVLPRSVMLDETMLSITGQPTAPHGNATWGYTPGMQPTQNTSGVRPNIPAAAARPPRPRTAPQADIPMQPAPLKPRVPELEKHLTNQLSSEEQDSLNTKFQEATIADKKVEELEKEIIQCREKIDFYRTKMQEIILYKSRCDNRLNEIIERVSADKHEAESLAKKYEQKCMQVGDVASKLTSEEATFRDIQEKKMELYQEIVKLEGGSDDDRQARAEKIQSGLDKLVKSVNERCKKYGLRAKPSSLVEIPFGWQPGIQEASADWDENWDNFEEEGFTLVKELTLDVQNVVAPPKPKFSTVKREITSEDDNLTASDTVAKSESGEQIHENEFSHDESKNDSTKSPDSVASRAAGERPSPKFQESQTVESIGPDGSPHAKYTHSGSPHYDAHSDHGGGLEPVHSGEKKFEEAGWGRFDIHYDTDSVWGTESFSGTEVDHEKRGDDSEKRGDDSIFGTTGDFGLKPIKTDSPYTDNMFSGKTSSLFADSVPSTPAYNFGASPEKFSSESRGKSPFAFPDSVPSTPAYNFGSSTQKFGDEFGGNGLSVFVDSVPSTPANHFGSTTHNSSVFADSVPSTPANHFGSTTHNSSVFADSVPSTPAYNFRNPTQNSSVFADSVPSTPAYNFGSSAQDHSFDHFSRFDSFNTQDSGGAFQQSPRNSLSRFDSSRDFDTGHGYSSSSPRSLARFDSVRSSADFDPSHGFSSSPRSSFARFDSVRGSADFDSNNGFSTSSPRDSFARFDSFRSSKDYDSSQGFSSFDDSDPFGSGPFRTSVESQAPKKGSDSWSAF